MLKTTGHLAWAVAALGSLAGCKPLRVRWVADVPPPPQPGHAKLVIVNPGPGPAEISLRHEDASRFQLSETVQPGAQLIREVPAGKLKGTDQYHVRPGVLEVRRGTMKLKWGKSYEWRVGPEEKKE